MSLPWPTNTYLVSRRHKLVFVPIPKVGTTTLTAWLLEADHKTNLLDVKLHTQIDVNAYKFLDEAFKFTFVRNPYTRLVSGFVDKVVRDSPPTVGQYQKLCAFAGVPLDVGPSFRDFLRMLEQTDPMDMDPHWRPQHLFLGDVKCDHVGKLEAFDETMEMLHGRTGVPMPTRRHELRKVQFDTSVVADCRMVQLRGFRACAGGWPPYRRFWTPELKELAARVYSEDFERFGYEK